MPKAQEEALKKAGRKKGYTGERLDHFVYGIMNSLKKKKKKGK
jgi:hypothetical protein